MIVCVPAPVEDVARGERHAFILVQLVRQVHAHWQRAAQLSEASMGIFRQTVKHYALATLMPRRLLLVSGRHTTPAKGPCASLTFDDGPHPEHTPRLLDALAEADARATFFVIGEKARRYPHLLRRIVGAGHELGNHTYSHGEPKKTSAKRFLNEIRRTRRLLQDLVGCDTRLVRPPKGELTPAKCLGLWQRGETIVLWNVDPRDYAMRLRLEMDRWCDTYEPTAGDVVLMHDAFPFAEFAVRQFAQAERFRAVKWVPVSRWLTSGHSEGIAIGQAAQNPVGGAPT